MHFVRSAAGRVLFDGAWPWGNCGRTIRRAVSVRSRCGADWHLADASAPRPRWSRAGTGGSLAMPSFYACGGTAAGASSGRGGAGGLEQNGNGLDRRIIVPLLRVRRGTDGGRQLCSRLFPLGARHALAAPVRRPTSQTGAKHGPTRRCWCSPRYSRVLASGMPTRYALGWVHRLGLCAGRAQVAGPGHAMATTGAGVSLPARARPGALDPSRQCNRWRPRKFGRR